MIVSLDEISLIEFVTLILPWKTEWMSKVEYELYNLDAKASRDEPHGRAGEIRHWWNFSVILIKKLNRVWEIRLMSKSSINFLFSVYAYRKLNHKSIHDATNNRNEIESIPVVFKVTLKVE